MQVSVGQGWASELPTDATRWEVVHIKETLQLLVTPAEHVLDGGRLVLPVLPRMRNEHVVPILASHWVKGFLARWDTAAKVVRQLVARRRLEQVSQNKGDEDHKDAKVCHDQQYAPHLCRDAGACDDRQVAVDATTVRLRAGGRLACLVLHPECAGRHVCEADLNLRCKLGVAARLVSVRRMADQ